MNTMIRFFAVLLMLSALVGCGKRYTWKPYVQGGKNHHKIMIVPDTLSVDVNGVSMFPPDFKTSIDSTVLLSDLIKKRLELRGIAVQSVLNCEPNRDCLKQAELAGLGASSGKYITLSAFYSTERHAVVLTFIPWVTGYKSLQRQNIQLEYSSQLDEDLYISLQDQLTPWVDKALDTFFNLQAGR